MLDTKDKIVAIASRLAQTLGFNAFSYADIATAVGIRKASIHHHFPAKTDLGEAMVQAYRASFSQHLHDIDAKGGKSSARLKRYAGLYKDSLQEERMCLCGMFASDVLTLPASIKAEVGAFFADHVTWLARVLEDGRRAGEFHFDGLALSRARLFLATLQGALLVARGVEDKDFFDLTVRELIAGLVP